MTVEIILFQTDIAQNMGSIMRTATCWGVPVHLIEPMGFIWNEPKMRRAGMDYLDRATYTRHMSWQKYLDGKPQGRLVALTTKGSESLLDFTFEPGDRLIFGRESAGLPDDVVALADARVRIPMREGERSMNVAQSCAVATFEALRQLDNLKP